MEAGEEGFADDAGLADDAADPGDGNFADEPLLAAELSADEEDEVDQIGCGLVEDPESDGIAGFGQIADGGGESGEVGAGGVVAEVDQLVHIFGAPYFADGCEDFGGLFAVVGVEGAAHSVEADPVTGAFVAEAGAPAASALAAAIGHAADGVGAGAGDLEDSGAAFEGGVEGDDFVADDFSDLGGAKLLHGGV